MPTVLQVTPGLDAGGVERTTIEIAQALSARGWGALVASAGGRLEGELLAAGGRLARLPLGTKTPWGLWANALALARLAARERVDIIHARSRAPAWSALWAARRLKLPFVTTYHGIYNARSALKRFYNGVMARGDVVIANSEFTRAHVLRTHGGDPDRVVTIPRGADLARFDPAAVSAGRIAEARDRLGFAPGAAAILAPARLTAWKGQRVAIAAAAALRGQSDAPWRMAIAGDAQGRDGYVAELAQAIAAAGLGEQMRIVGHVADMPAALAACDFAVFPTLEPEAFGRGAVEAQAMGRPVAASALGGFLETVRHGETGFLTPAGDAQALAGALAQLLALGPEGRARMGHAAQIWVRGRYSTTALQEATLAVYSRLVAKEAG